MKCTEYSFSSGTDVFEPKAATDGEWLSFWRTVQLEFINKKSPIRANDENVSLPVAVRGSKTSVPSIMLYKVILAFDTTVRDHSNDSYRTVLLSGTVFFLDNF